MCARTSSKLCLGSGWVRAVESAHSHALGRSECLGAFSHVPCVWDGAGSQGTARVLAAGLVAIHGAKMAVFFRSAQA